MFKCNDINLLVFTYCLKLLLGIIMTIIPLIYSLIIFVKYVKYKEKNDKINKLFFYKQKKSFLYINILFIFAYTLHNCLNKESNVCYNYATINNITNFNEFEINENKIENTILISYNKNDENILNLKETDYNKQNSVYIIDGVFYYPRYNSNNWYSFSGTNCPSNHSLNGYNNPYGYNNYFYTRLISFIEEANKNGYKITINSQGCRTYSTQQYYYRTMTKGRAAYPGYSLHGWGIAADLEFYQSDGSICGWGRNATTCPSMGWAHNNAYNFGLTFPLINASYKEDWHIEPINKNTY